VTWTPKPIFGVYNGTTSGTSTDFVYSRHISDSTRRKTYAFALETGPDLGIGNEKESFQPVDDDRRELIKSETKAALLTLMEQTVCGIDFIGTTIFDRPEIVEEMADIRDDNMARTRPGREWLDLFHRVQGPLLAAALNNESVMKEAMRLFEIASSLVDDASAQVTSDHIANARSFLRASADGLPPKLRRDIDEIERRLVATEGQTLAQVVDGLSRNGPAQPRIKTTTIGSRRQQGKS